MYELQEKRFLAIYQIVCLNLNGPRCTYNNFCGQYVHVQFIVQFYVIVDFSFFRIILSELTFYSIFCFNFDLETILSIYFLI